MPAVTAPSELLELIRKSGLVEEKTLEEYLASRQGNGGLPEDAKQLAAEMVRDGLLTHLQAGQLLAGKSRGFVIAGKYKLLEHLGAGGMGTVYLCEHTSMRRRVAIKVLPIAKAKDASYLERFYREARAVGALDHPNIVRAHDIDHDDKLHFLVMEYVDGSNLHEMVRRSGPMDIYRACHYISQAAHGLQHAHDAGLVHRDIKPANLLVDRTGTVKILDLGLARFFHDDDQLSKRYDETLLGTTDYLAPEQTIDSNVDGRADIYSLGVTFYFILTASSLFGDGTSAQKLIWHQTRQPKPIHSLRPEIPEELAEIIEERMLAKQPEDRFQRPIEICEALAPWTEVAIPPPPEAEMPHLCPAARGTQSDAAARTPPPGSASTPGSRRRITPAALTNPKSPLPRPRSTPGKGQPAAREAARRTPNPVAVTAERPHAVGVENGITEDKPFTKESRTRKPAPQRSPAFLPLLITAGVILLFAGAGVAWWVASALFGSRDRAEQDFPGSQTNGPRQSFYGSPTGGPPQAQDPVAAPAKVTIQLENGIRRVRGPQYEADIAADGCMTSLRVAGVEMLWTGGDISRGCYFFQGSGALKLSTINQPADNAVLAKNDRAEIRYEFGPSAITCTVTNATDTGMPFFLVFDRVVQAMVDSDSVWSRLPVQRSSCPVSVWFADKARLKVIGGTRLWGPFEKNHQVWEASLAPHETRKVVLEMGLTSEAEAVQLAHVTPEQHIRTAAYEAIVGVDGCLTRLRSGGVDLLQPDVDISRGAYLHQQETIKLPDIKRASSDLITATGDKASLRYEFGPSALTCTATNATDQPMSFYMVFTPEVHALRNGAGEWFTTPLERMNTGKSEKSWQTTTWYAGRTRLTITGGDNVWGPWSEENLQVWEATLAPHETRKVVLSVDVATTMESAKVAALTGAPPPADVDLLVQSPLNYQVFQRYSRMRGQIQLRGRVKPACTDVEVRLTGMSLEGQLPGKWEPVGFNADDRTFDSTVPVAAGGWYKMEIRALHNKKVVADWTVEHVGVGEVFVISGQSNATNCGEERLKQSSGLVSSFDGKHWQLGDDPQKGVHDHTAKGSPWPAFANALVEKYHVPVGIASTGHSGTSVGQWQPGGELFTWMMTRIRQLGSGGFRAVLWHQGENDVGMKPEQYEKLLTTTIQASRKEAGWDFPWFVARVSYHNPGSPSFPNTRTAQKNLWDKGIALEGPDTDKLTGDNRDGSGKGIHFSGKGLRAHGKMWAEKVSPYLDKILAE